MVSAPTRSARMTNDPVPFTVPPATASPGCLCTGTGSPVIIDSSTALAPSMSLPSTGIRSPGLTRSRSPGITVESGTSVSVPSSCTRRATGGVSDNKFLIAAPVRCRARNSRTWPTSTSVTMTAAASKYTGTCPIASRTVAGKRPGATTATTLSPKATATPSPMSVNMLRRRVTSERHARSKNGQPAHKHTGVASASSIQGRIDGATHAWPASHAEHRQEHERGGEQRRHPEAPRHVRELGRIRRPPGSNARLERHSADRTNARSDLHHLGIHRAGVLHLAGAGC